MAKFKIGPGALIAAAFIGPGTVTTATLAGANYGYVLLWGIVFSTLATILLQEMAMRLGVAARLSLGEAIRQKLAGKPVEIIATVLVLAAIVVGNAAYEGGNLSGAAVGVQLLGIDQPFTYIVGVLGFVSALILWQGKLELIKGLLAFIVMLLSLVYVTAAIASPVDWSLVWSGILLFRLPAGAEFTLIALIGTTVVPYNLFLHASAAREQYPNETYLKDARVDLYVSIALGGLITLFISILSAAAFAKTIGSADEAKDLIIPLQDLLGEYASVVVGLGYLAAGFSSAIAAPLAAAFALSGILKWTTQSSSPRFKLSWLFVLVVGLVFSMTGYKPVHLILVAQVANGVLLPIIAAFLVWVMNDKELLGRYANTIFGNVLGSLVILITLALGARSLYFALS